MAQIPATFPTLTLLGIPNPNHLANKMACWWTTPPGFSSKSLARDFPPANCNLQMQGGLYTWAAVILGENQFWECVPETPPAERAEHTAPVRTVPLGVPLPRGAVPHGVYRTPNQKMKNQINLINCHVRNTELKLNLMNRLN